MPALGPVGLVLTAIAAASAVSSGRPGSLGLTGINGARILGRARLESSFTEALRLKGGGGADGEAPPAEAMSKMAVNGDDTREYTEVTQKFVANKVFPVPPRREPHHSLLRHKGGAASTCNTIRASLCNPLWTGGYL